MILISTLISLVYAQTRVSTIDGTAVYTVPGAAYWTAGGAVDADGAPNAYNAANTGIDYLANAGSPSNWWGLVTRNGQPVEQQSGDPNPGYYVSSTSLIDSKYVATRQCAYANAAKLSFFVIPSSASLRRSMGNVVIGDLGIVVYRGVPRYSMFADSGPTSKIGEASVFLLEQLGHNPFSSCCGRTLGRANRGIPSGVTYIVFPGSGFGQGWIPTNREINHAAASAFKNWGGCDRLKQVVPGAQCNSLASPNIRSELDTKCPNNGVLRMCASNAGMCASRPVCDGFGGQLQFGTTQCASFGASVGCCTRAAVEGETDQPLVPAPVTGGSVSSPHGPCTGIEGQCLDSNVQECPTGQFQLLKCPGTPTNILCCPSSETPRQVPAEPAEPVTPCTGVSGSCLDSNMRACGNGFLVGACPGLGTEIKCCPDTAVAGERPTSTAQLPTENVQGSCAVGENPGVCIQTALCPLPFQSFAASTGLTDDGCRSIPSRTVQCCSTPPAGGGSATDGGAVAGSGSCAGLFFPIASGSLLHISVNWGNSRSSGRRCHAGLDIYTTGQRKIVATGSGVVTAIMRNWYSCSGGTIDAILVYHSSGPLAGKTINYGEMNPGTYSVRAGSSVTAGQELGVARNCGMLHFELYEGRRTTTTRWMPGSRGVGSGCTRTSMSTKPRELLDPRPLLNCLKPANAQFRHGVSFLQEPQDSSLFDADLAEEHGGAEDGDVPAGSITMIALIVTGVVLLCVVSVIGIYYLLLSKKTSNHGTMTIDVDNETYGDAGDPWESTRTMREDTYDGADTTGTFECQHCPGKVYAYAADLQAHVQLRH